MHDGNFPSCETKISERREGKGREGRMEEKICFVLSHTMKQGGVEEIFLLCPCPSFVLSSYARNRARHEGRKNWS